MRKSHKESIKSNKREKEIKLRRIFRYLTKILISDINNLSKV